MLTTSMNLSLTQESRIEMTTLLTKREVLNELQKLLQTLPDEVYSLERYEEGYADAIKDAIHKIEEL